MSTQLVIEGIRTSGSRCHKSNVTGPDLSGARRRDWDGPSTPLLLAFEHVLSTSHEIQGKKACIVDTHSVSCKSRTTPSILTNQALNVSPLPPLSVVGNRSVTCRARETPAVYTAYLFGIRETSGRGQYPHHEGLGIHTRFRRQEQEAMESDWV